MTGEDKKLVRAICREEIELALKSLKKEATALARRNDEEPSRMERMSQGPRQLPIDDMVDALEAQAMAPVLNEYQKRRDVGMSKALAEVMAKIDQGMDLTPMGFNMPAASYFGQLESRAGSMVVMGGVAGFREHFIKLAEDGDETTSLDDLYEATCAKFGVPSMKKPGRHATALSELPASPRGGFRLGRGEAAERVSGGSLGQLAAHDDGEEE